jgi:DNA polymerase
MQTLSIDIETFSTADLKTCGTYKYAECGKFRLLLFAYSVDGGEVKVADIENGEAVPQNILDALVDENVIKWAYNANFERVCLSRWFLPNGCFYDPKSWRCTMVWGGTLGLPMSLDGVSKALNLKVQKLDGTRLINTFCKPSKNGQQSLFEDEEWENFRAYNRRDVEVELELHSKLANAPVPESEWELYSIDQRINDRGVLADMDLVSSAIAANKLAGKHDKTSVAKYRAILRYACVDNRVRGMFAFHGSRTGRWAGCGVNLQNLPAARTADLEQARTALKSGQPTSPETLSELIRTAFIPKAGHKLLVADFSAIEARILAWLAGEKWKMDVFRCDGRIYEYAASRMFKVPIKAVDKELRQRGKTAELGLGYAGGVGALISMGALDKGIAENELQPLVDSWRTANPNIVRLWKAVETAAVCAVDGKTSAEVSGLRFEYIRGNLFITLPSGRRLCYVKAKIGRNAKGYRCVKFMGISENRKWHEIDTYGGKLVENICQAIARDLLAHAMKTLQKYDIVLHVHDEIVLEVTEDVDVKTVCELMSRMPEWADGLHMTADGFDCAFYQKN